jgi:hypothetical protein
MRVATDSQKIAVAGVVAEAAVNVSCSIYLARHTGTIGVANGTLLGTTISVGAHFVLNMYYTKAKFAISRVRLFFGGLALPSAIAVPSLFLVPRWWSCSQPEFGVQVWLAWVVFTLLIAWFVGLNGGVRLAAKRVQPAYKI